MAFLRRVLSPFSLKSLRFLSSPNPLISFSFFEERTGDTIQVKGEIGKKVLDIALENNVDIEGFNSLLSSFLLHFFEIFELGACGGELACSTCHVKVQKELFDQLPVKLVEEEDMLDLAWGVTET